jgi:hypothetical protein
LVGVVGCAFHLFKGDFLFGEIGGHGEILVHV